MATQGLLQTAIANTENAEKAQRATRKGEWKKQTRRPSVSLAAPSRFIAPWGPDCWSQRTSSAWHTNWLCAVSTSGCRCRHRLTYKGLRLDCAFKADIVVQDIIIVELKSVDTLTSLHEAQVLTYMRMASVRTGLLINFNVRRLVDGVRRFRR